MRKIDIQISQIGIIVNTDGFHTTEVPIGCIVEDPFVLLTEFLTKYYIQKYESKDLYPMTEVSFQYALSIRSLGSATIPHNFSIHAYHCISDFKDFNMNKMKKAEVIQDSEQYMDYFNILSAIKDTNPIIQKAIDYQDYIVTESNIQDFKTNIIRLISSLQPEELTDMNRCKVIASQFRDIMYFMEDDNNGNQ